MRQTLDTLCSGADLSAEQTEAIFGEIVSGEVSDVLLSALLMLLKAKGETPDEMCGAARALSAAALPFDRPDYDYADCCGTGGDGSGTVNLSTAVALVVAEAGLPVAKHGNRSVSSRCGSADVLEALGTRLDAPPEVSRRALDETRFCFLFAPHYHAGLRHAMPVRRALGVRTVMNLLGPLVNPARPPVQLVGVYDESLLVAVARTLAKLGCKKALVVHGSGLDELALHGPTRVAHLDDGSIEERTLTPEDAGLHAAPIEALRGGAPEDNAAWLDRALRGETSRAEADAIALNAGALLWIAGRAVSLREGASVALDVIASGKARARLAAFVEQTGPAASGGRDA